LAENGIKLTIATARSGPKSLELLKDLHLNHPLIVMDGAMIITSSGEILMTNAIDEHTTKIALEIGKTHNIEPFVIGIDYEGIERFRYTKNLNNLQQKLINEYKKDKRLQLQTKLTPLKENVKTVYIGKEKPLRALKDEFEKTFDKNIEIKFSKDPYIDGYFLTLLHPKGDKAHALKELQSMGDFANYKTTVFGDSHNDMGMFELADRKIAVKNALDELKDIATEVLPHTNDEDAVAKYLYKLI
jgi:Cof subfamily protein (haloacid dehalogenase superfamily)